MENTMIIKTNMNVIDYVSLVNSIVSEFFDGDGEYVPHIGRLNAMRLFYNECVLESKFDLPHDFQEALDLDVLIEDEEFIKEFNDAVKGDGMMRLDFANAYAEAMKIVNTRKDSFNSMANALKNVINNVVEKMSSIISDDAIAKFTKIAENISSGDISAEALIDAYGKSQRINDIASKG